MDKAHEHELIDRCLQGEVDCFEEIVNRYETMVRTLVARLVKDEQAADEISHQVFVQAYEKLDQFKGRSKFSTWLGQIALNKGRDHLRKLKTSRRRLVDWIDHLSLPSMAPGPLQQVSACQQGELLRIAMAGLNVRDRNVIVLRHVREYDYASIADLLGSTPGAVKLRNHRAMARLRNRLTQLGVHG